MPRASERVAKVWRLTWNKIGKQSIGNEKK